MNESQIDKDTYYSGDDLETLANAPRYAEWITELMLPFLGGHAAEFGAGAGTISQLILPQVTSLDLIEPSKQLAGSLQQRFSENGNVRIIQSTIEDNLAGASHHQYDVVLLVNVLEHIEDDIAALRGLRNILKPQGNLLLYVPALPSLYSKFDELVGHYRRYTRRTLEQSLSGAGFEVRSNHYVDILGMLPWYLVNTIGGQTKLNDHAVKLYDTVGVPFTRFFEKLIQPPLGKNLFAAAKSPDIQTAKAGPGR